MEDSTSKSRIHRLNLALLLVSTLALLWPASVSAHIDLERAEPENRAILDAPPDRVKLWFDSELDTFESTVAVFDERGRQVDLGDAGISLEDRTLLQVSLPDDLPPGTYTIRWTAVDDEDAHPIDDVLTFTFAGTPELAGISSITITIMATGGIAVIVAVWLLRRRWRQRTN